MKTAILTDSGCALTPKEARELGVYCLPLQIIDGKESYRDNIDITTLEVYERLRQHHMPKTSMPMLSDIQDIMREIKDAGYEEIVAIPLSSGLSSTFNSIRISADELCIPVINIEIYTTCDLQAYDVLYAKQLADQGFRGEKIKEMVEKKVKQSGTLILPNDIQHLKRGGRLTPLAATAASLLKIKPILRIDQETNGKIDVVHKVRTERKATFVAVDYVREKMKGKEGHVFVIHSDNISKAEEIKAELLCKEPQLNVTTNTISAVIAAHTGLDCIAIQYIEK